MMRRHVYLGAAILPITACALFLLPEDCDFSFGGHGGTGVPFDLAFGFVGSRGGDTPARYSYEDDVSFGFLAIKDCDTGEWGQITHFETVNGEQQISGSDRIDEFQQAIRDRNAENKMEWVFDLAKEFGFLGSYAAIYEDNEIETCGCRVIYPGLRGSKDSYSRNS